MLKAYLVDDELPALKRLTRLLESTKKVEIIGWSTNPADAIKALSADLPDVLFLDIQMPGMNGFDLLASLERQPVVIFTTAYDQYALDAFCVNSIDYLLKPIEPEQLERALSKAERMMSRGERPAAMRELLSQLSASLQVVKPSWLERIASKSGDKVEPIDLRRVTHFFAKDKLTFAVTVERSLVVDLTIAELEQKL